MTIHPLDLRFLGIDHAIAAYLVPTSEGPVLVEAGPHSTFGALEKEVNRVGYELKDIRHVLLSHIHFDHAGAAWALAALGAKVYVHPFGYQHILNPEKLYQSAKRIYGDEMERLWGEMHPIPAELLHQPAHGETLTVGDTSFTAWHTPGHAKHHIAWQMGDVVFTGDVAGVAIQGGPAVAPCPPPDIDVSAWKASLALLRGLQPARLYLTHFGAIDQPLAHLGQLETMLDQWAEWMYPHWQSGRAANEITPEFQEFTKNQLRELGVKYGDLARYEAANPSFMSVAGLLRYWTLKSEGKLA